MRTRVRMHPPSGQASHTPCAQVCHTSCSPPPSFALTLLHSSALARSLVLARSLSRSLSAIFPSPPRPSHTHTHRSRGCTRSRCCSSTSVTRSSVVCAGGAGETRGHTGPHPCIVQRHAAARFSDARCTHTRWYTHATLKIAEIDNYFASGLPIKRCVCVCVCVRVRVCVCVVWVCVRAIYPKPYTLHPKP